MMAVPIRRRTRARELSLQFLYAFEMRGEEAMSELDAFIEHHTKTGDGHDSTGSARDRIEIADYARKICSGVHDHLPDLNHWIEHIARNWRLERMAYIDRNILRIALFELLYETEIPFKVVINEAIDIAKRFSTAQSGSFVNGILDRARVLIQDARTESKSDIPAPPPRHDPIPDVGAEPSTSRKMDDIASFDDVRSPRPTRNRPDSEPAADPQGVPSEVADDEDIPAPTEYPNMPDQIEPSLIPRPRRRRIHRRRPHQPERPSEPPSEDI